MVADGRAYTVVGVCPNTSTTPRCKASAPEVAYHTPSHASWSREYRDLMVSLSETGKGLLVDFIDPCTSIPTSGVLQPVSATVGVLSLLANEVTNPLATALASTVGKGSSMYAYHAMV